MKKFIAITVSSLALALSMPATAQETDATTATADSESQPIDPLRIEAAKDTVDYLFPVGTYERMMKGTMDQMMDQIMTGMGNMRMGDLAGAGGVSRSDIPDDLGDKTMAEIAAERDPHYQERMKISTKVMMDEMVNLMIDMEPTVRKALTNIYARKFTVDQLNEMTRFFSTDTGSAFARDYMMVFVDPEMMQSMMSMVPEMMQAMPDIMKKVEEATAHLPPVKVTENDPFGSVEDIVENSEDYDDAVSWAEPANWSAEDRELVNKLSIDSEITSQKYYEALEQAQKNAKARMAEKK